jgi:outer membrane protein assembly factor BamB
MMLRRLMLSCAVLCVAACSNPRLGPQPTPLADFKAAASFKVRWHASLGDAANYFLRPAIAQDSIAGVSSKGVLTALERSTGKVLWTVKTGIKVAGGVGGGASMYLLGGDKGEVLAFDLSGHTLWSSKVSSAVLSAPEVADGVVVVRSGDSRITGLDALDGKRLWTYERATPSLVVRSHASVTLQRGIAYAGFAAGKIVALDIKNGSLVWENTVSLPRGNTELDRISDITSDVQVDDGQACAISFQGRIACFDAAQGSQLWNRDLSSDKGMMMLRKFLYLSDANGVVMSLDKTTGSSLWKNDQLTLRDTNTPYAFSNFVVAGDFEGYLHAFNREDGQLVARIKLDGSPIQGAVQGLDDGLLVQTRDGGLYSLTLQ